MRANFSGTKMNEGFVLIPKGRYLLTVDSAEEGETADGDEKWTVDFIVAEEGEQQGKTIRFITFTTSEKALPYYMNFLWACGFDVNSDEDIDIPTEDVVGKQLYADVYIKKDKSGEYPDKNQISLYNRADEGNDEEVLAGV